MVKVFSKSGLSCKTSYLDLGIYFCTEEISTHQDDRWVQRAHMSVAGKAERRGVLFATEGIEPGLAGTVQGTDTSWAMHGIC